MPDIISVRLPPELARKLDSLVRELERPRSYIIRKALESYLAETLDYQIALDRLKDPEDEVIPADEVRRALGG